MNRFLLKCIGLLFCCLPLFLVAQLEAELPDLIISTDLDSLTCKIYVETDSTFIVELEYNEELQEGIVQKAFVYKVIRNFYVTGEKPPLDFNHSKPEVADISDKPKMPIKGKGFRIGIRAGFAYRLSNQPISYFAAAEQINSPLRSGYFTEVCFDYFVNRTVGIGIHHTLNRASTNGGNVAYTIEGPSGNIIARYEGTWQEQVTVQTIGLNLMTRSITLQDQLELIGYGSIMYARIEDQIRNIFNATVVGENVAFSFGFDGNYYLRHNLLFNMGMRIQLGQVERGRIDTSDELLRLTINNDQIKSLARFDLGVGLIFNF